MLNDKKEFREIYKKSAEALKNLNCGCSDYIGIHRPRTHEGVNAGGRLAHSLVGSGKARFYCAAVKHFYKRRNAALTACYDLVTEAQHAGIVTAFQQFFCFFQLHGILR